MRATLAFLFLLSLSPGETAMAQGRNADKNHVLALDDEERGATLARDVAALERLLSEEFFVNAPNNRVVVGRQAMLDVFVRSGIIDFARFERTVEHVHVDSGFVFVMGLETVTSSNDAPSVGLTAGQTIRRRFTNIWKNENGVWRLFARHANVIPSPP
jgi:ketosteroid isomerase-like protein